jgi:hypothetical protein
MPRWAFMQASKDIAAKLQQQENEESARKERLTAVPSASAGSFALDAVIAWSAFPRPGLH